MTKAELSIRPAMPADATAVKAVLRDTFEATWQQHLTAEAVECYLLSDRAGQYVGETIDAFTVAEMDGRIIGMVHWYGDFIEALHVCRKHQRLGVGRRLIDYAEQEIHRAGFDSVRLETDTFNEASRSFYVGLGYVEIDRYPDLEWDSGFTTILLEKRLGVDH